jgi:hypothetical protein
MHFYGIACRFSNDQTGVKLHYPQNYDNISPAFHGWRFLQGGTPCLYSCPKAYKRLMYGIVTENRATNV